VPDVKAKTLQGLIRGKVSIESAVMTDGWQAYDGLVDVGHVKHFRLGTGSVGWRREAPD
jgi:transposase-like protein